MLATTLTVMASAGSTTTTKSTDYGKLSGFLTCIKIPDFGTYTAVDFGTKIGKECNYLSAEIDILNYSTGNKYVSDGLSCPLGEKCTYVGGTWDSYNKKYFNNKLTVYGCHEARKAKAYVVYTSLKNK